MLAQIQRLGKTNKKVLLRSLGSEHRCQTLFELQRPVYRHYEKLALFSSQTREPSLALEPYWQPCMRLGGALKETWAIMTGLDKAYEVDEKRL